MVGDWWAKVRHNQSRFCSLTNFIRLQISLSWQQPFSWQPARCSAPLSFSWPEYECQSEEETEHSSGPILTLHSTNLTVTNGKDFIFFPFHYECIICQYIKVIMTKFYFIMIKSHFTVIIYQNMSNQSSILDVHNDVTGLVYYSPDTSTNALQTFNEW